MIECIGPDGGRSFQLVPRSREIEPRMGQHVSEVPTKAGGSIGASGGSGG